MQSDKTAARYKIEANLNPITFIVFRFGDRKLKQIKINLRFVCQFV